MDQPEIKKTWSVKKPQNSQQTTLVGIYRFKAKKSMKKQNLYYHSQKQRLNKFTLAQQIKQNLVKSGVFLMLWETLENAKQFNLAKVTLLV